MSEHPTTSVALAATGVDGRSAARAGVLVALPLLAGYVPFALVIGSVVAAHGSPIAGWSGSWLIFGGSAHLAAIRTLDQTGPAAAILTGLLINGRLVVYSASLARRWAGQPRWFRVAAAGLIVDPTWAIAEEHASRCRDHDEQRGYFLGAALTLAIGWSAAIGLGALLGARLDGVDLRIVVPVCLLGLVGAELRAATTRTVILVAAVVAFLTTGWPAGTGVLAAVIAGGAAGVVGERGRR